MDEKGQEPKEQSPEEQSTEVPSQEESEHNIEEKMDVEQNEETSVPTTETPEEKEDEKNDSPEKSEEHQSDSKADTNITPEQSESSQVKSSAETKTPESQPDNTNEGESMEIREENIVDDLEEKTRKDALGNMEKIEKEFMDLKEKFFSEKIEALKKECEMIRSGTHQGFLKKCQELEEIKKHKTWAAEKWREYQLQNIENIFNAEKNQAEDEFKADQKILREKMLNSATEKRKKLLDEKSTMHILDSADKSIKRNLRRRGMPKEVKEPTSYKRSRLNPPHINYSLKEGEINEDISLISKVISSTGYSTFGKFDRSKQPEMSIYSDRGRLMYQNRMYEKGTDVVIEAKHENGKWSGILVSISPVEIHIKGGDGTKSRFTISQLRSGKFTLS